jgi:hypothetical protein
MNAAKDEVRELLDKLPENCSLKDVQYHLYVIEKIKHGLQVAEEQGTLTQEEAEARLKKKAHRVVWLNLTTWRPGAPVKTDEKVVSESLTR